MIHTSSSMTGSTGRFDRIVGLYKGGALLVANTVLCLVLTNVILAGLYFVLDHPPSSLPEKALPKEKDNLTPFRPDGTPNDNGKRIPYQLKWIDGSAYENLPATDVSEILDDFHDLSQLGFIYQPWVHFSEPLFQGKRVSVVSDQRGIPIRRTTNPANQKNHPSVTIFVLGGSTTFGYNVGDEHTWPSYLSRILNEYARARKLGIHVEVVNYGRGYYYPSQETMLLVDLLRMGHRPNLVLFMDGVNPGSLQDLPPFYERFERKFKDIQFFKPDAQHNSTMVLAERFKWIPLVRFTLALQKRVSNLGHFKGHVTESLEKNGKYPETEHIVNIFKQNQLLAKPLSEIYGIHTLFFTQPNAVYNYPSELYRLVLPDTFLAHRGQVQPFYNQMRQEKDRIYLGDLFGAWGERRKAIVDDVHYSPGFNRFLAEHVAKHIDLRGLVPRSQSINEEEATGTPRSL